SREARPAAPPTVVARRARRGRLDRREGGLLVLIAPDAIRSRSGASLAPVEAFWRRPEVGRRPVPAPVHRARRVVLAGRRFSLRRAGCDIPRASARWRRAIRRCPGWCRP